MEQGLRWRGEAGFGGGIEAVNSEDSDLWGRGRGELKDTELLGKKLEAGWI